jgi:hypothetical protein
MCYSAACDGNEMEAVTSSGLSLRFSQVLEMTAPVNRHFAGANPGLTKPLLCVCMMRSTKG